MTRRRHADTLSDREQRVLRAMADFLTDYAPRLAGPEEDAPGPRDIDGGARKTREKGRCVLTTCLVGARMTPGDATKARQPRRDKQGAPAGNQGEQAAPSGDRQARGPGRGRDLAIPRRPAGADAADRARHRPGLGHAIQTGPATAGPEGVDHGGASADKRGAER